MMHGSRNLREGWASNTRGAHGHLQRLRHDETERKALLRGAHTHRRVKCCPQAAMRLMLVSVAGAHGRRRAA